MPDVIIRRYGSIQHGPGTKGHKQGRCTECKEPATASVDWFGETTWTGSYCKAHLETALANFEEKLGHSPDIDDRRLGGS